MFWRQTVKQRCSNISLTSCFGSNVKETHNESNRWLHFNSLTYSWYNFAIELTPIIFSHHELLSCGQFFNTGDCFLNHVATVIRQIIKSISSQKTQTRKRTNIFFIHLPSWSTTHHTQSCKKLIFKSLEIHFNFDYQQLNIFWTIYFDINNVIIRFNVSKINKLSFKKQIEKLLTNHHVSLIR